jgi:hypothetical protein
MDTTVQYRCPHLRTTDERVRVLADELGLCRRTFWLGPLSRLASQRLMHRQERRRPRRSRPFR